MKVNKMGGILQVEDKEVLNLIEGFLSKNSSYYNKSVVALFSNVFSTDSVLGLLGECSSNEEINKMLLEVYKLFHKRCEYYLGKLKPNYRVVITERFGFNAEGVPKSYSEIAASRDLSRGRITEIYKKGIRLIQKWSKPYSVNGVLIDHLQYLESDSNILTDVISNGDKRRRIEDVSLEDFDRLVAWSFASREIHNLYQLRDYLLENIPNEHISELDVVDLIMSFHNGYPKAANFVRGLQSHGFWEFVTSREDIDFLSSSDKNIKNVSDIDIKNINFRDIIGDFLSCQLYREYGINDIVKLRDFITKNTYSRPIMTRDVYRLFISISGVGDKKAEFAIKGLKKSGYFDFVTTDNVEEQP